MLEAHNLSKAFRVARPRSGPFGAMRHLLAPVYETRQVVVDVSLTLGEGDLLGLLGPNGAGKSTIQKMLTGVLQPSAGYVQLDGRPAHVDRPGFMRQIGAVFGHRSQLWWDLPLADSFRVVQAIYQIPETQFRTALLPRPRVLFLDEPTLGLDVEAREAFHRVVLARHAANGLSVILTTHDVADIDALCARIAIVRDGRIVYEGSVKAAKDTLSDWQVLLCHVRDCRLSLEGIGPPAYIKLAHQGNCISLHYDRSQISSESAVAWLARVQEVTSWTQGEVSTSDMLLGFYTKALDAGPTDAVA